MADKKSTLEKVDQAQAEVAKQETWDARVQAQRDAVAKALPKHIDPDRYLRVALSTIKDPSSKLAQCERISVLSGLMDAAQLGLELSGPLGEAYLVPRWNNKTKQNEATFQIGYQGFRTIAWRNGITITPVTVYEGDHFEFQRGTSPQIDHRPVPASKRGEPIAYYATATFPDGRIEFEVMWHEEMLEFRDKHRASDHANAPWQQHFDAMAHKTMVKQVAKNLPKSIELAQAMAIDTAGFQRITQPLDKLPSENPDQIPEPGQVDDDGIEEAEIVEGDDAAE